MQSLAPLNTRVHFVTPTVREHETSDWWNERYQSMLWGDNCTGVVSNGSDDKGKSFVVTGAAGAYDADAALQAGVALTQFIGQYVIAKS